MPTRLLLPVALVQGLWLKLSTPRLPPARGRRGRVGGAEGPASQVVGLGDSIIAGTGVGHQREALTGQFARRWHEHLRRPVEWHAHGFNGATSAVILRRIAPRVPAADVYLISAGVNDAVLGVRAASFEANLRRLRQMLEEKSPHAAIVFAGLPPLEQFPALPWPLGSLLAARARELQAAARRVVPQGAGRMLCYDFPPQMARDGFASDGFHPAAQACDEWARQLLELWLRAGVGR